MSFVLDGRHIEVLEVTGMHGNRIHKFDAPLGNLQVNYTATIVGQADRAPVTEYDLSMYLRPSRYAGADKFYGFAGAPSGVASDCFRRTTASAAGRRPTSLSFAGPVRP